MSTFEKVVGMMAKLRDIDAGAVTPETKFADLGFDSMDRVELIMQIEEEFGLNLENVGDIKTVGEASALIDNG